MSAQLVRQEILAFLRTSDPSVHCIRGRWGVGKTFTWNRALLETRQDKSHSLKDYAYVSLFGMNSLEDVKSAIFENTVQLPKPDIAPSLESLRENLLRLGKGWRSIGRIGTWATTRSTWLRNYVGAFGPLCFATVTDRIICIDDIERRGKGLDVSDVLGLASYLKENRRCKIALILNDEALESQESDFRKYFEKVVDVSLSFTPTNKECIEIGLRGETPDDVYLAQCCGKLNISNIRVLRKIAHLVDKCKPLLLSYDRSVTLQAIRSIALLSWCIHEPHLAPPLSYLTDHKRFVIGKGKEDLPKDQAAWNSLLDHYEFGPLDDFEFVLLDGIKSGFFDASRLEECARAPHSRAEERDFSSAWETYHSTFANNEEEVLDVLFGSFQKNVKSISLTNLSGTVKLFKELGARERATELIALYLECHGDSEAVMDLAKSPWGTADIRSRCNQGTC